MLKKKKKEKEKETFVDCGVIIKQLKEINDGKNGQKGRLDKN
jgi:hypothetical protein